MEKFKNRKEVPEKYKWNLSDFFKSEQDYNDALQECKLLIDKLSNYNDCVHDAVKLFDYLNLQTEVESLCEALYGYACLKNDEELGISENLERKNKIEKLCVELENRTSFFAPSLLMLSKEEYNNLFKENEKLNVYKFYLDIIYKEKEHILSEKEENIVSELIASMNHFEEMSLAMINNEHDYGKVKLLDGTEEVIAPNNYRKLLQIEDESIRKQVYNSFNKVLDQYGVSSASFLNGFVNMCNSIAKIHNYKSSWHQKLNGLNLSGNVFKTLSSTIENNVSYYHKFLKLKKKIFNKERLNSYDLYQKLSSSKKEYSIEDAQSMVKEALRPLGEDYIKKYDIIINNNHIDYCQYKGKYNGGYALITTTHNPRILMNYNYDMDSISTIAHEAGHHIHQQYINENNPLQYRQISLLVAEVASLTNECLLSKYILNNSKNNIEKQVGLENIINVIENNLYGAVREAKMEEDMYNLVLSGGVITKEYMDELTISSKKKYYGDNVILDEYIKNGWITRNHYYMNFYLYNYAISVCVAINVADEILAGNKEMLDNYKKFLSHGADIWPYEAFKILGIDLEDKKVYERATKYFGDLIDQYNELLEEEK